jgi:hypothetical protein
MVVWVTAEQPDLPLYAAKDPRVERWYQEDQLLDVVRSDPHRGRPLSSRDGGLLAGKN